MAGSASQVIGRYTIYGKIASGGMASVHFGRLVGGAGFSRTVAIKRLHPHLAEEPEFLSTMIDEARLAARIHHPNVVPMLDVVTADGELLLVMEYVRGESLARLLKTETTAGRRVSLPVASAIAIGALHGLHAAHEARNEHGTPLGIVHRDVSPQNILVGIDGMARVIDFGVAKAAGRLQTTQDGSIKGKVAYMAPEQLAARPVTRTGDVYAMGVVLWELVAGTRIFQADNDASLVTLVLAGPQFPPSHFAPDVPRELDAIVMKALAFDPAERFATALEMAETLQRVVPPAFSTEVGAWCEGVARDSIAKRGALLAEIESSSGIVSRSSAAEIVLARDGIPVQDEDLLVLDDDPPIVATQPSSLSVETPKPRPSIFPRGRSRGRMIAAGVGAVVGVLIVGILAMWSAGKEPAGTRAVDQIPSASAPLLSNAAAPPLPSSDDAGSGVGVTPSVDMSTATPAGDTPVAPTTATAPSTAAPRSPSPPPAHPSAPQKPKSSCNPPYVLDSAGHRQYKPECL